MAFDHFVSAQEPVYPQVICELAAGKEALALDVVYLSTVEVFGV